MTTTSIGVGHPSPAAALQTGGADLRLVRHIGTLDGPLAFTGIGAVAAHDTLLAITDVRECQIIIYNTLRDRFVERVGRCGGGPGEFRNISAVTWLGDSLLVADQVTRSLQLLAPDGRQIRVLRPDLGRFAAAILSLDVANDSTVIAGLGLLPAAHTRDAPPELAHAFAVTLDVRTGAVRDRFLLDDDPASRSASGTQGRSLPLCLLRTRPAVLATLNTWRWIATLRLLDEGGTGPLVFTADVPGMRPVAAPQGGMRPAGIPSVACAGDLVLFKWQNASPPAGEERSGYLEVRDRRGGLVLSRRFTWADSTLFGVAAAAAGDRFWIRTNRVFDHPVLLEYRLERGR